MKYTIVKDLYKNLDEYSGKKVTLTGFCTFSAVDKEEKQGRNPRTGAPVTIPARTDVKIKAGSKLKEALN